MHSILTAAPAYLERRGRPQQPQDLTAHDMLSHFEMDTTQSWTYVRRESAAGVPDTVKVDVEPRLLCGEFNVLLQATLAGQGICMLTESVCGPHILAGELEHVLPDWHAGESVLHLVYLSRRGRLPAVRAVADFLVECLPPLVRARRAEVGCPVETL